MLYAIIPTQGAEKRLESRMRHLDSAHDDWKICFTEAPNIYVIEIEETKTADVIAKEIGVHSNEGITGVVMPFSDIWGYANRDFWEWIRVNR